MGRLLRWLLTALALARDSDLFATGVDIHGVTTSPLRAPAGSAARLALREGRLRESGRGGLGVVARLVDRHWRSPVLLVHGDDDRTSVSARRSTSWAEAASPGCRLRGSGHPGRHHHFLKHANWLRVNHATAGWFEKKLLGKSGN